MIWEVVECFSLPEILELKVQNKQMHYCDASPNCLQCLFGHDRPIFKVVPNISVECVINCLSWRYNSLCTMLLLLKKIIIIFILNLLVFSDEVNFTLYQKSGSIWYFPSTSWQISNISFLLHRQVFRHTLHKFFTVCTNGLSEFC